MSFWIFRVGTWKPNDNWKNIILGGTILIAVIIDQVIHIIDKAGFNRHGFLAEVRRALPERALS